MGDPKAREAGRSETLAESERVKKIRRPRSGKWTEVSSKKAPSAIFSQQLLCCSKEYLSSTPKLGDINQKNTKEKTQMT